MTVTVSVVSGADQTLIVSFLRSVIGSCSEPSRCRVVAVVNRPDDDLAAELRDLADASGWSDRVEVWRNERPLGFAANHNRVMDVARSSYYVIANDDVIVRPGTIDALVRFMEEPGNERVAVVAPKLLDPDETLQPSTYSFPTPSRMLLSISGLRGRGPVPALLRLTARALPRFREGGSRYWAHDRTVLVDSVRGAFMLVRAEAVSEAGPMDEVSLVGGEETEWHRRMADHGWRVAFFADAEVVHLGSRTVGLDPSLELEYLKGRLNYFDRYMSRAGSRLVRLEAASVYGLRWLGSLARGRRDRRMLAAAAMKLCVAWRPDAAGTAPNMGSGTVDSEG